MEAFGKFFQSSQLVFVRLRTQQRADKYERVCQRDLIEYTHIYIYIKATGEE